MNFQTNRIAADNSTSAIINRLITGTFSLAIIGAAGVLTFVQFVTTV